MQDYNDSVCLINKVFSPSFSILEEEMIEESCFRPFLVDKYGLPISDDYLMEANTSMGVNSIQNANASFTQPIRTQSNPGVINQGGSATANLKQSGTTKSVANTTPPGKPVANNRVQQNQSRNFDQELQQNQAKQQIVKDVKLFYHIACQVAAAKLSVTEKLFKDYATILFSISEQVKRHQGIKVYKEQEKENTRAKLNNQANQINDIKHQKRVEAVRTGGFKGWWKGLWV